MADLTDDLAKMGSFSSSGGSSSLSQSATRTLEASDTSSSLDQLKPIRQKVRFAAEVDIGETWSAEEYPARSMRAPFDPELEFPPARRRSSAMAESLTLTTILEQRAGAGSVRSYPDLRRFW